MGEPWGEAMSESPKNIAFAKMRKKLTEAERKAAELEAFQAREQRVRTAYFMATDANLPEPAVRMMVAYARKQDGDLKDFFNPVREAFAATTASPEDTAAALTRVYEEHYESDGKADLFGPELMEQLYG